MDDNPEAKSRKWTKFPAKFRKDIQPREHKTGQAARQVREQEQEQDSNRELAGMEEAGLEETSRKLCIREEELLSHAQPSEEDVDRLQRDLEVLKLQVLMVVQRSFTSDDLGSGLTSAVAAMRLQEALDRRWSGVGDGPRWRPLRCLGSHNALLANVVESRLEEAARDGDQNGAGGLATPIKRQVCGLGKRAKADLLRCARVLQPCYGDRMDVLNIYAGLCHRSFSARLSRIVQGGLEADDSAYLLFWVNMFYPQEILQHEELRGKLKTECLGSLLQRDQVRQLEEQYGNNKEAQVSLWLRKVLQREEESWTGTNMPEVMDDFFFCPLAIDVIQVIDGSLADLRCLVGEDGSKSHRVEAHLESFLLGYKKCLEKLSQRKDEHASTWMKAHLACEEQLRDYISRQPGGHTESQLARQPGSQLGSESTSQPGSKLARQPGSELGSQTGSQLGIESARQSGSQPGSQPGSKSLSQPGSKLASQPGSHLGHQPGSQAGSNNVNCEAILDALREFVYSTFTGPIHGHLKVYYRQLWTLGWLDGSLPVMDSLLDSLSELFSLRLRRLKASCRHSLVHTFQREFVSEYVRRMSKSRLKSGGEQAAERVAEDAGKMDDFFHVATGCGDRSRFGPMLRHVADLVRLQRPGSVREEMVAFAEKFPDFSDPVLSALLALKSEVSAADVRSVRRGVSAEVASTNQRPALFSRLKGVKWVRTTATRTDTT
ncbi:tumor necrosis factor alpha-induced protein 2-like isoform X3 [Festucalex cinctus]